MTSFNEAEDGGSLAFHGIPVLTFSPGGSGEFDIEYEDDSAKAMFEQFIAQHPDIECGDQMVPVTIKLFLDFMLADS